MKKTLLVSALALAAVGASAQQAIMLPKVTDNWSIGVDGGVTTPLVNHPFFGSMRGTFGANISKQLTPIVGAGIEGNAYINTSSWQGPHSNNAIDMSYVGAFGTVNLMNLFGGYQCEQRPFTIDAIVGVGWGHKYFTKAERPDDNFAMSKAGLNLNYNVNDDVTLSLQPSVQWNMTSKGSSQSSAAYDASRAGFQVLAGVTYHFGGSQFDCVVPMDPVAIEAMNAQINALRADLDATTAVAAQWQATASNLNAQLQAYQAQGPTVIETQQVIQENTQSTVRYVFFKIGSSAVTADQMPNVEQIADYLKDHPAATVVIKGYASKDGNQEFNIKLAQSRAESVKNALVKKYGVKASRIQAEGEGIGNMFDQESWNRVSICTINND